MIFCLAIKLTIQQFIIHLCHLAAYDSIPHIMNKIALAIMIIYIIDTNEKTGRFFKTRKKKKYCNAAWKRMSKECMAVRSKIKISKSVTSYSHSHTIKFRNRNSNAFYSRKYGGKVIKRSRGKSMTPYLLLATNIVYGSPLYNPFNEIKPNINTANYIDLDRYKFCETDTVKTGFVNENKYQDEEDFTVFHAIHDENEVMDQNIAYKAFRSNKRGRCARRVTFDTDSFKIGIDTYASICMSNCKDDFVQGTMIPLHRKSGVTPYGKGEPLQISMKGTLIWKVEDDKGGMHKFYIPNSIYVPDGTIRLMSPQHWAQECTSTVTGASERDKYKCTQLWDRNVLSWVVKGDTYQRTVYNDMRSNVPTLYSATGSSDYNAYQATVRGKVDHSYETCFAANTISDDEDSDNEDVDVGGYDSSSDLTITPITDRDSTTDEAHSPRVGITTLEEMNHQMSNFDEGSIPARAVATIIEADEEALTGMTPLAELKRWHYRLGHLSFQNLKVLAEHGILPKRLAAVRNPKCACCIYGKAHRTPKRSKGAQGTIKTTTRAGQCVSVDQMESSSVGFIGQLKGKLTTKRYKYATVFIDHYSRYTYVHLQSRLTSEETMEAKKAFEAHARSIGVGIEHYHADNGRFADNAFLNDVKRKGQSISFCGVNAHWQNGIAERMIRTLRESARTQLLHAVERWPSAVTTHLWPYALTYAAYLQNHVPNKKMKAPINLFTGVDVTANMKHMHAFGCPVYALDSKLQAGKHLHNWRARARMGVNLGPSPRHAKTVSLVLSLQTGLVSPQFHIQHDEFFESIDRDMPQAKAPWRTLARLHKVVSVRPLKSSSAKRQLQSHRSSEVQEQELGEAYPSDQFDMYDEEDVAVPSIDVDATDESPDDNLVQQEDHLDSRQHTSVSRVSGRIRKRTNRMHESIEQGLQITSFTANVEERSEVEREQYYEAMHEDDYTLQDNMADPIAFKASTDPDTMYYHEAISAPDKDQFLKAIVDEVNAHIDGNHWKLVPRESVPKGEKILDSVWAMKRKRDIKTREVYKHKARLNIHGGQQEYGVHYKETYSPVVSWSSVRTILLLAKINGYVTRQVDFILAYPQADIPYDNYMNLPHGIKTKTGNGNTHVLKLLKNIYGGKNSGLVWMNYLKEGLENIGFVQSSVDSCVFYRGEVIFFYYVDDGIFVGNSKGEIDKAIRDLKNRKKAKNKYDIDDQGDITDYLGINFDADSVDGNIQMTQPHLIDQIVSEVGITAKEPGKTTPAMCSKILRRCAEEPTVNPGFNYRKVIGKLNFLEKSSRPDIAYAVHQCARFCEEPKEEHVKAVRHLAKYLRDTRDKGLIMKVDSSKACEVWVDADFSGNWNKSTAAHDPSTAKSRSGYVITFGGCPILWTSKLQTQIALSSCEAEYISLSQSLREAIPLMRLLQELKDRGFAGNYIKPKVKCKAFEDNTGALALATTHKMRPRTKHINLVYHHFREAVRDGIIEVISVGTKDQIGDMFTKPLPQNDFVKFRKLLMGW